MKWDKQNIIPNAGTALYNKLIWSEPGWSGHSDVKWDKRCVLRECPSRCLAFYPPVVGELFLKSGMCCWVGSCPWYLRPQCLQSFLADLPRAPLHGPGARMRSLPICWGVFWYGIPPPASPCHSLTVLLSLPLVIVDRAVAGNHLAMQLPPTSHFRAMWDLFVCLDVAFLSLVNYPWNSQWAGVVAQW